MKARVLVKLKEGVLDVQGATVQRALAGLGFSEVKDLRVGKVVEVDLDGDNPEAARRRVEEMCLKLLANTVTEQFSIEILPPR
jgi:phosphoribosylformylglycinamidine synthase